MLERARFLAAKLHEGQTYGINLPYTYHLNAVEQVMRRYTTYEPLLVAAVLHDSLEDTWYSRSQCGRDFTETIATIVWAVSNEKGKNRAERHRLTYPKILKYCGIGSLVVKLADRIANVEACQLENSKGLLSMYRQEYTGFREALYRTVKDRGLVGNAVDDGNIALDSNYELSKELQLPVIEARMWIDLDTLMNG